MKNDALINKETTKIEIKKVAQKLNLKAENLISYGLNMAKINYLPSKNKGKLILVTAITPTPAGEGKTTTSIGLADALNLRKIPTTLALREPSMGPVFGRKGGATGGGKAQIMPMENINLHFTGDIHAITSANNLIAATIDNHIFWGNELKIAQITWKRCLDMNDRSLRNLTIKIHEHEIKTSFQISAASEIMAIFCLAKDLKDLANRLDNIVFGFNLEQKPLFVRQLKITKALIAILQAAFKPNLVQTLEHNPAILHGGPFANIAHGCNSIRATNLALATSEVVVTEAGFGADLGAEKFLNIKARIHNLTINTVVVVATIKALKLQGGQTIDQLKQENIKALANGIKNLAHHLKIIQSFKLNYVIALNKVASDSPAEITWLMNWAKQNQHLIALSNAWAKGGKGALELADLVIKNYHTARVPHYTYDLKDSLETKIAKVATTIYGASQVVYSAKAQKMLQLIISNKLDQIPICIAKTPANITDSNLKKGYNQAWTLEVDNLSLSNGAGFIVVECGNILTMPGLPSKPRAEDYN